MQVREGRGYAVRGQRGWRWLRLYRLCRLRCWWCGLHYWACLLRRELRGLCRLRCWCRR